LAGRNERSELLYLFANKYTLAYLRVAVFSMCFVYVLSSPISNLAYLPAELFEQAGLLRILPLEFLISSPVYLQAFRFLLLVLIALVILGPPLYLPLAVVTTGSLFIFDGLIKGFAHYHNHAQFSMLYTALILSVFPAANAFSLYSHVTKRADKSITTPQIAYQTGAFLIAFFISLPYLFMGARRFSQGFEIFTSDQILRFLAVQSLSPSEYGFQFVLLFLDYPLFALLASLGFFVVTVLELLTPVIIISRLFRVFWLLIMIPFHIVTLFTMNILFWENVVLLLLVFSWPIYSKRNFHKECRESSEVE